MSGNIGKIVMVQMALAAIAAGSFPNEGDRRFTTLSNAAEDPRPTPRGVVESAPHAALRENRKTRRQRERAARKKNRK